MRPGHGIGYIVEYRIVEHHRLLLDIAYLRAVIRHVYVSDIHAVHEYLAVIIVIEAHEQIDEGRFARARGADYADHVGRLNDKVYVVEHLL